MMSHFSDFCLFIYVFIFLMSYLSQDIVFLPPTDYVTLGPYLPNSVMAVIKI